MYTGKDKTEELLGGPLRNIAQSFFDDYTKENQQFRTSAGVRAIVERILHPPCCEWCTQMAGVYDADDLPDDIYRRHDNCDCEVLYTSRYGTQNVHTKKFQPQEYRPVNLNAEVQTIKSNRYGSFAAKKLMSYKEPVFLSTQIDKISRRDVASIVNNTKNAMKRFGIPLDKMPNIVIVKESEIASAYGSYDAVTNTVYYIQETANINRYDEKLKKGAVQWHEMWHLRQAVEYQKTGRDITAETYNDYISWARKRAKEFLDNHGINGYNVREISRYAKKMYRANRFDEVEAEFMIKKRGKML